MQHSAVLCYTSHMLRFNENNEVIRQDEYKAILVGLQRDREEDISYSMEELKGLAEAANAEVLGMMTQNLERPNTATLIGKGKVEELAELVKNMEADTVIFNDELSGMQLRNLEDALDVRVIDRTILILDIFAQRASSAEGKLQVELAQLQYRMPRLIGFGKSLSRLGGGIGTRGPGEKKLEMDRRLINDRIAQLRRELAEVVKHRDITRAKREKQNVPVVAIVGYTNAGKSTLLKTILGKLPPISGEVQLGDYLFPGYFEQEADRDSQVTALDTFWAQFPSMENREVRLCLAKCGLTNEHITSQMRVLSGGENAKVRLAIVMNREHNWLILDEPTNHLDVDAKEELKRALKEFPGSVLLVSHDPTFYEDWVTRILNVEDWTTKIV